MMKPTMRAMIIAEAVRAAVRPVRVACEFSFPFAKRSSASLSPTCSTARQHPALQSTSAGKQLARLSGSIKGRPELTDSDAPQNRHRQHFISATLEETSKL